MQDAEITAIKWFDNRGVFIATKYVGVEPTESAKRWDLNKNQEREIPVPAAIEEYNSFLGQTDNIGRLMSSYRIKVGVKKDFI